MNTDILNSLNSAFGGPLVKQTSRLLDEPEAGTRSALRTVFPALLAGAIQRSSTVSGATELYRSVTDARVDAGVMGRLPQLLGDRGSMDSLLASGESLAGSVLGNRTGEAAHAISQSAGIKSGSAIALLSMGAPLLFGLLKKHLSQSDTGPSELARLLFEQRGSLAKTGLDNRVASALGFGSLSSMLGALPGAARESVVDPVAGAATPPTSKKMRYRSESHKAARWWPWGLAAGVALLVWWALSNRNVERPGEPTTAATQSGRTRLASLPSAVYFESGQTQVGARGRQTVEEVADLIKQEDMPVAVTGYTDRSGDPERNAQLAKERATAVKDALVKEGVTESNIVMKPPAFVTGAGSDAEARRVDITAAR